MRGLFQEREATQWLFYVAHKCKKILAELRNLNRFYSDIKTGCL